MGNVRFVEQEGPLRQVAWSFWYNDSRHVLVLDGYAIEERPSPRHKFKVVAKYARLGEGRSYEYEPIQERDVPMTDEVCRRAREEFMASVRVVRWSTVDR
jgi:hypothetical protein